MRKVILESPFAGNVNLNIEYARACVADSLRRGEAPLASHLLYTQPGVLDDGKPEERRLGIDAGHAWLTDADAMVVYSDFGHSAGMVQGMARASRAGIPVETRTVGFDWARANTGYLSELELVTARTSAAETVLAELAAAFVREWSELGIPGSSADFTPARAGFHPHDTELSVRCRLPGYRAGLAETLFDLAMARARETAHDSEQVKAGSFSMRGLPADTNR